MNTRRTTTRVTRVWALAVPAETALLVPAAAPAQWVTPVDLDPAPDAAAWPLEGVAVDTAGNLWVSVQLCCQVRRHTADGLESLRAQPVPTDDCMALSADVVGLTADATERAYAALITFVPATRGVVVIDPGGDVWRIPDSGRTVTPNALAFDRHNGSPDVTGFITVPGAVWRIGPDGEVALRPESDLLPGTLRRTHGPSPRVLTLIVPAPPQASTPAGPARESPPPPGSSRWTGRGGAA